MYIYALIFFFLFLFFILFLHISKSSYLFYLYFTMESTQSTESFPKRIRSVSARLFSMNNDSNVNTKRTSCHIMASSPEHHSILNPSKWFPRMRCRSSSSASSTFSLVFSSSVNSSYTESYHTQFSESHHLEHHVSLESVSSELEGLYNTAKEEVYIYIYIHLCVHLCIFHILKIFIIFL